MRTAEEIMKYDLGIKEGASISFEMAVIALNKARKEAIEECAKVAADHMEDCEGITYSVGEILINLITELK